MNNRITRREVAKQFIVAIELLLESIEQKDLSIEEPYNENIEENPHESCLLTAPEVARILNISKGGAYRLIQQGEIPSVRINCNVRVRLDDLNSFIANNMVGNLDN